MSEMVERVARLEHCVLVLAKALLELSDRAAYEYDSDDGQAVNTGVALDSARDVLAIIDSALKEGIAA